MEVQSWLAAINNQGLHDDHKLQYRKDGWDEGTDLGRRRIYPWVCPN
ncbi:hypothetical protein J2TS4_36340 [Paenibacillus sp. J2TS4]|nr:hypothetical protein J2TS4_36340 [Paenibacillus sp. J2TS4]